MATKGAHVFRLRKTELAQQWMQTLNIKHYKPSLASLNYDFDPISQPTTELHSSPHAHIDELPDSDLQISTKRLPVETWQMVCKLSQVIATTVPRKKTPTPFKFNQYLQAVYEHQRTPLSSQLASIASGTRSHDSTNQTKPSLKRGYDEPASKLKHMNSLQDLDDVDSPTEDVERQPVKKKRATGNDRSQTTSPSGNDEATFNTSLQHSTTTGDTPLHRSISSTQNGPDSPTCTPISFDWNKSIPQALVLDFFPDRPDSPKIGVWFLPSEMVCLFLYFLHVSLICFF